MSDYGAIDLSGAIVTASGVAACRPRALTVHGRSTQDGTPTPSAPVGIVSVANPSLWSCGRNLAGDLAAIRARNTQGTWSGDTYTLNGVSFAFGSDGSVTVNGTATALTTPYLTRAGLTLAAGAYRLSGCPAGGGTSTYRLDVALVGGSTVAADGGSGASFTVADVTAVDGVRIRVPSGATVTDKTFWPMLSVGAQAQEFAPYDGDLSPIGLQGNQLRSLPDGTRDELAIDGYGHATLTKRVGSATYDGTESWTLTSGTYPFLATGASALGAAGGRPLMSNLLAYTGQITASTDGDGLSLIASGATLRIRATGYATADAWRARLAEAPMTVLYPLATPQVIDLGTVELANLTSPDLTAWVTGSPEIELTALLKTGRSTVMWDGEELGAGWTFVSDRREQLLPTDVATIDVPGRDGALFGGVTRAVRQVTLALYVLGPVGERAPHVRELAARLAVDGPRPLMFGDEAPLWRTAVPNAESESEVYFDAEGYTDVEFVCPDPWLYGEERSVIVPSGGSVTFTVGGTAPTWPTIAASATGGSQGTWILRLDDSSKGIYAAIASGVTRPVVADCDARTLTVNSTTSMLAPSYDWPELTPGTHTLAMTQGTGAATVTWTERWW